MSHQVPQYQRAVATTRRAMSYYPPYYPSSSADEARTRAQKWDHLADLLAKLETESQGIFWPLSQFYTGDATTISEINRKTQGPYFQPQLFNERAQRKHGPGISITLSPTRSSSCGPEKLDTLNKTLLSSEQETLRVRIYRTKYSPEDWDNWDTSTVNARIETLGFKAYPFKKDQILEICLAEDDKTVQYYLDLVLQQTNTVLLEMPRLHHLLRQAVAAIPQGQQGSDSTRTQVNFKRNN